MKYKELLELYREGKLSKEEAEKVSYDIERQDAISEYLFDTDSLDEEFEFDSATSSDEPRQKGAADAEGFAKEIKKSIRKAFIKAGAIAVAAAVAIVLLAQFALPGLVDKMYYQPDEELTKKVDDIGINRMSIDIMVYSELFLPGKSFDTVNVRKNGYGDYDLTFNQSAYIQGLTPQVSGHLKRNKLVLYDEMVMEKPFANCFEWTQHDFKYVENGDESYIDPKGRLSAQIKDETYSRGSVSNKATSEEIIKDMNSDDYYIAYINFDKLMSFNEALKYMESDNIHFKWLGVITKENGYSIDNLGFEIRESGRYLRDYNDSNELKKYPNLMIDPSEYHKENNPEKLAKEHFISLLKYYRDQDSFRKIIEGDVHDEDDQDDKEYYNEIIKYIEKNGLSIHGFGCITDKATLQDLIKEKAIYTIDVRGLH